MRSTMDVSRNAWGRTLDLSCRAARGGSKAKLGTAEEQPPCPRRTLERTACKPPVDDRRAGTSAPATLTRLRRVLPRGERVAVQDVCATPTVGCTSRPGTIAHGGAGRVRLRIRKDTHVHDAVRPHGCLHHRRPCHVACPWCLDLAVLNVIGSPVSCGLVL